jgi:hypothetical protein
MKIRYDAVIFIAFGDDTLRMSQAVEQSLSSLMTEQQR